MYRLSAPGTPAPTRPSAPCAAACPVEPLGALSDALTERPTATVVALGASMGAVGGALVGLAAAAVAKQNLARWAMGGAFGGAVALAVASYGPGTDLARWLGGRS
jgi:hypothetical protein